MNTSIDFEVDFVERMKVLLSSPGVWIQGKLSTTETGEVVPPTNPAAVHFCILGAICKTEHDRKVTFNTRYFYPVLVRHHYRSVTEFNDSSGRTVEEILNFLDEVILSIKGEY